VSAPLRRHPVRRLVVTPRLRWAVVSVVGLVVGAAVPLAAVAQDIDVEAWARGVELPPSYYRTIERNPDAFMLPNGLFRTVGAGATRRALVEPASGAARIPVVLALFLDSREPPFPAADVQRVLFDGPAPAGTITQAYEEMSFGSFTVTGDVFGWVRTSLTMLEAVGTESGFGPDADLGRYFAEALDLIDPDVDFTRYDNDGPDGVPNSGDDDGVVDALVFEFLEVAGSCGGPSIWPHRSGLAGLTGSPYATDDASAHPERDVIVIDGYITQGVTDCAGAELQRANVITHEFGHVLGLRDYYHWIDRSLGVRGRRWVLGCWELMAAGSWGCGPVEEPGELRSPFGPTHMSAWSKYQLGWVDLVDVGEVWNEEIVLEPIQISGVGLRLPLDDVGREFLIAEYRGLEGFDAQLPGQGVLFYKQDLLAAPYPSPTGGAPYRISMLERDDDNALLRMAVEGGNRGETGDLWGVDGNDGGLHFDSEPPLRMSDGGHAPVTVHEVRVDTEAGTATLVLSTGATPRLIAPDGPFEVMRIKSFRVPLRIAGGLGPYTGLGDLPSGFSLEPLGDALWVVGSLREEEPRHLAISVRDAEGRASEAVSVALSAPLPWTVEPGDLVEVFTRPATASLTDGETSYLDDVGNRNGRYDVGDLRRWMRANR